MKKFFIFLVILLAVYLELGSAVFIGEYFDKKEEKKYSFIYIDTYADNIFEDGDKLKLGCQKIKEKIKSPYSCNSIKECKEAGFCYLKADFFLRKDGTFEIWNVYMAESLPYYKKACELGDKESCLKVSVLLSNYYFEYYKTKEGEITLNSNSNYKTISLKKKILKKGISQEIEYKLFNINTCPKNTNCDDWWGSWNRYEIPSDDKNDEEVLKYANKACELDESKGCFIVGLLLERKAHKYYYKSYQQYKKLLNYSYYYLKKACDLGNLDSCSLKYDVYREIKPD